MPYDWKDKALENGANFLGFKNHKKSAKQIRNAYFAAIQEIKNYDLVIYEQFFSVGKHLAEKHGKPAYQTNLLMRSKLINLDKEKAGLLKN